MNADITPTIQAICNTGYSHYVEKNYSSALRSFYQAWLKVPKPQKDFPLAATILSAIGDTYFRLEKYDPAIEALRSALACPQTQEHSLILMRLGQSLLDNNQELQAKIYLHKAFKLYGESPFVGEDPKYRDTIIDLII
jgi:tetratricopeptide (TPR) repeat protein